MATSNSTPHQSGARCPKACVGNAETSYAGLCLFRSDGARGHVATSREATAGCGAARRRGQNQPNITGIPRTIASGRPQGRNIETMNADARHQRRQERPDRRTSGRYAVIGRGFEERRDQNLALVAWPGPRRSRRRPPIPTAARATSRPESPRSCTAAAATASSHSSESAAQGSSPATRLVAGWHDVHQRHDQGRGNHGGAGGRQPIERAPAALRQVGVDPARHAVQAEHVQREERDVEAHEQQPEAPFARAARSAAGRWLSETSSRSAPISGNTEPPMST